MRLLGKPVELGLSDAVWLNERLPRDEIYFIRKARIDLLVPIAMNPGAIEAMLALGVKRSEEPYTREDNELLEAIAASLALLLDRSSSTAASTANFEECPECGACYDSRSGTCTADGVTLSQVNLPRILAGRYQLDRRHGRGGMGTVYEAKDSVLKRRVAVKVIRDEWVGSGDAAQRFRREAHASASFAHPNVVTVYDFGVEAGTRGFLVMEFLNGDTLREEINRCKQLDPDRTLYILRCVCRAVDAAHSRQLIHRDLKPENIFLSRTGQHAEEAVKVLDFGIAKFLPTGNEETNTTLATHTGLLVGTPAYMSPEQLVGRKPDVSWDIWALAVVAYESLTGALPFGNASSHYWQDGILSGKFTPLDRHLPDPPPSWQRFFSSAFSPNPVRRPRSAMEFLRGMEKAFSGKMKESL
jgi:serine/threonine-protein kinase